MTDFVHGGVVFPRVTVLLFLSFQLLILTFLISGKWQHGIKNHCRCRWLSGALLDRPDFKELFLLPAVGQDLEVAFANALFKSSSDEFLVISEPLTCAIFSLTC